MINLVLLALCFVGILFILSTLIAETLTLIVLKWGNLWQSFSIVIIMNAVSSLFVICNVIVTGSISTGIPVVNIEKISTQETTSPYIYPQQNETPETYLLPSESQEPIIGSTAWNISNFAIIVIVESVVLYFASLTRSLKNLSDGEIQNSVEPPLWKTFLRALFLSLCANTASFMLFFAL